MEDAHDTSLGVKPRSPSAHVAEGAEMLIIREHVVLSKPEPEVGETRQPDQQGVAAADVPGSRVVARNAPRSSARKASPACR